MLNDNLDQIAYWNGAAGQRWTSYQEAMDRVLRPLGDAAMSTAQLLPGERVLDVGCGCGDTTLALARSIGNRGHVLGVDVSAAMLARARERLGELTGDSAPVELLELDAALGPLPSDRDLVFSRFGVMFFADPVAAFAHLRTSLRGHGRLVFVCWRAPALNPWASLPMAAITPHLVSEPPVDPRAPGPFAFADKARLESLLTDAGYRELSIVSFDRRLQWTRSADVDVALDQFLHIGPAARRLAEATPPAREAATAALRELLARNQGPEGLFFDTSVWLVSARAR